MTEGIRSKSRTKISRVVAPLFAVAVFLVWDGIPATLAADEAKVAVKTEPIDTSRLAPDLISLAKMIQSGVGEKVVLTYIQLSPPKRSPSADELVYLHELGLSSEGMVALMNAAPKGPLAPIAPTLAATPTVQATQSVPVQETVPAPQPATVTTPPVASSGNAVISSPPPTVVYTQPAPPTVYVQPPVVRYVEPYPRFSFGISLGHVFGHHHHGGHWGHHGGHYRRHH